MGRLERAQKSCAPALIVSYALLCGVYITIPWGARGFATLVRSSTLSPEFVLIT